MRSSTIIMIALAVVFGSLAAFLSQSWIKNQTDLRMRQLASMEKPSAVPTRTLVVASGAMRYGAELSRGNLKEVAWPADAIPSGGFATIADVLNGGRRVALASIETNEPVLGVKITGPGQRGTLSAMIGDGMKAVTVRVNDVHGVAGFVLPGDRIDLLLTRPQEKGDAYADVILQGSRVLAIDQVADERADKPSVVKAVTLEVDTFAAQKVALAATIGTLSLSLRRAGELEVSETRRIGIADLNDIGPSPIQLASVSKRRDTDGLATVTVTRGSKRQDYTVPREVAE